MLPFLTPCNLRSTLNLNPSEDTNAYSCVPPVVSVSVMLHIQVFYFQTISLFQELNGILLESSSTWSPQYCYHSNSIATPKLHLL